MCFFDNIPDDSYGFDHVNLCLSKIPSPPTTCQGLPFDDYFYDPTVFLEDASGQLSVDGELIFEVEDDNDNYYKFTISSIYVEDANVVMLTNNKVLSYFMTL